jgi:hypothetical protein
MGRPESSFTDRIAGSDVRRRTDNVLNHVIRPAAEATSPDAEGNRCRRGLKARSRVFGEIQVGEQCACLCGFRCATALSVCAGDTRGRSGGRVPAVLWLSAELLIGGGLEGVEHREAGGGAETVSAACDRDVSYRG